MSFTGDIASMDRLVNASRALASVPARAALRVAKGVEELIGDEFDSGTDPYGTAWMPLAASTVARGRFAPPLTDTREMRDGVSAYVTGARTGAGGVTVTVPHPAAPHQTGWVGPQGHGPARPILPERQQIPATWDALIYDAVSESIQEVLK